jgi:hypothetical protein
MPRTRRHGIAFRLALGGRTPIARLLADRGTNGVLAIDLVVRRCPVVPPAAGVR